MKSTEHWNEVQRIVSGALELEENKRPGHVHSACSDPAIRADVEALLQACTDVQHSGAFLESPALDYLQPVIEALKSRETPGSDELRARLGAALAGRYDVQEELGRGGMATVLLARDVRHQRPVAVKVMHPHLHSAQGAQRFLREIRTLAALTHPHILPLHDSGEADGLLYYVTPFVEGESLRARLLRTPQLPVGEVLRILRELGDALDYAHAQGVVHRDIKPENILFQKDHALLADFGIARAVDRAIANENAADGGAHDLITPLWLGAGTPAYMAPEQANPGEVADHRVDLYALGIVTYEMLAGHRPRSGATAVPIAGAPTAEAPASLRSQRPEIPDALEKIVARLTATIPRDRYASAAQMLDDLRAIEEGFLWRSSGAQVRTPIRRRLAYTGAVAGVAGLVLVAMNTTGGWSRPGVTLDNRKVVVAAFEPLSAVTNDSMSSSLERIVLDWLTRSLSQTGLVTVVPAGALVDPSDSGLSGEQRMLQAARAAGAGTLITGSYYHERDSLFLTARISDVRTGSVRRSLGPFASLSPHSMQAIELLRQRVMSALAVAVDARMANWAESASQPSNIEAYQAFAEGLRQFFQTPRGNPNVHFRRAHALDTSFTTPLLWLPFNGMPPDEFKHVMTYLSERRNRLPAWDQGLLDWWMRRDEEAGYQAFRRVVEAAPQSEWLYMLAFTAIQTNRPATAVRVIKNLAHDRGWMREWSAQWWQLGEAQHYLGRYEAELATHRYRLERFPTEDANVRLDMVRALAALRRNDELEQQLSAVTYFTQRGGPPPKLISTLRELMRHGRGDLAESAGARLLAELESRRATMPEEDYIRRKFELVFALRRWDEAAPLLEWMVERNLAARGTMDHGWLLRRQAWLAASRRRRAEAESLATASRDFMIQNPTFFGVPGRDTVRAYRGYHFTRAVIHAHFGETSQAIAELKLAGADRIHPEEMHYHVPLDPLYGDPAFEAFASTRYDDADVFPAPRGIRRWLAGQVATSR